MAETIDKYPKCARCIYATIGVSGKPICSVRTKKVHKCKRYKQPNTSRYEFSYDGYHFVVFQLNFYSPMAEEELYVARLNVYLEPYNKTKRGKTVYMAETLNYHFPKTEAKLKEMSIASFETYFIGERAEA